MKMILILALAASLSACVTHPAPRTSQGGDGENPGQTLPPRNSDQ